MVDLWPVFIGVGFILLLIGAEYFTKGAASLARWFKVPEFVIGTTVVAIGTSLPELASGVMAMGSRAPNLAVGGVLGVNIAHLGLVIGLAAMVRGLVCHRDILRSDIAFLLASALILPMVAYDGVITVFEGLIFILMYVAYLADTYYQHKKARKRLAIVEKEASMKKVPAILSVVGGAIAVSIGAGWLIYGALQMSHLLNISSALIGFALVATGNVLPELVVSIMAAVKGYGDLAVGNAMGANIFNVFVALGALTFIAPVNVSAAFLNFTIPMLVFISILTVVMVFDKKIPRFEGLLLFGTYLIIMANNIYVL